MPRAPRLFIEGGIYHVYNRITRGEPVFAEDGEAQRFVEFMREIKQRDGLVVLAWCVMSNHYHLAVRCTSVPLWRSLASMQLKMTRAYNAHYRFHGPFWQGRYKAKLVDDPDYLRQLVLYIHLLLPGLWGSRRSSCGAVTGKWSARSANLWSIRISSSSSSARHDGLLEKPT